VNTVLVFDAHSSWNPANNRAKLISPETRVSGCIFVADTGPSRATAGPGKPLSRGPITNSFHMRRDRDAEGRNRRKHGEECPLTIRLGVWRSTVSSPQWGPGRQKWILCILEFRKKPSGTPVSVFLSDAPKRRRARENFPLSTGLR